VTLPQQASAERSVLTLPKNSTVHARFTNTIDSVQSHVGDPVTAVVTEPLFDDWWHDHLVADATDFDDDRFEVVWRVAFVDAAQIAIHRLAPRCAGGLRLPHGSDDRTAPVRGRGPSG